MDLGVREFIKNTLVVENLAGRPVACEIKVTYSDGTTTLGPVSPAVWKDSTLYTQGYCGKPVARVEIKISESDAFQDNNSWKEK